MATVPFNIHALDDPFYRSSDGKRMSDNTQQYDWIVAIQSSLRTWYCDDPNVLVVGDLLWYPVEGNNKIRMAPDAMVVFGRPQGPRGSYIQYREEGVTPQVVFEILSPGNRRAEMIRKLEFYDRYGVEEYYILNPFRDRHTGYVRDAGGQLTPIPQLFGWVSPCLGIKFEVTRTLRILLPDGNPLKTHTEVTRKLDTETGRANQATIEAETARRAQLEAERQAEADRQSKLEAERQAEADRQSKLEADQRTRAAESKAERLLMMLRAAGIDPDA